MLSEKEKVFLQYWEKNREELGTPVSKLLRGLPVAVLFTLPILLLVFVVYFYLPEWYTKVAPKHGGTFSAIFIALFICICFISFFRMQFKWEENEQAYKDLNRKKNKI